MKMKFFVKVPALSQESVFSIFGEGILKKDVFLLDEWKSGAIIYFALRKPDFISNSV